MYELIKALDEMRKYNESKNHLDFLDIAKRIKEQNKVQDTYKK